MTESFKQQLQELIDQAAQHNYPVEPYTTHSNDSKKLAQFNFKQGCEFLIPVLMKAVEQRNQNAYGYPDLEDEELLQLLKGNV